MRIDLEGNSIESVTAEQITHAHEKLKKYLARGKAIRAKREAREKKVKEEKQAKESKKTEVIKANEAEIKSLLEEQNKTLTKPEKKPMLSLKKKVEIKVRIT